MFDRKKMTEQLVFYVPLIQIISVRRSFVLVVYMFRQTDLCQLNERSICTNKTHTHQIKLVSSRTYKWFIGMWCYQTNGLTV